jgi:hypothetical protein
MQFFRTACATACSAWLGIALLAGCSSRDYTLAGTPPPPKPTAPGLNGTYRLDFDGGQQIAGGELKPAKSRTRNYALRTACLDSGCIATATKLADDDPHKKADPPVDLVFDFVDGHWRTALREETACSDSDVKGPSITAWDLQSQPDGSLTGTSYVAMNPSPDCAVATETPMTMTRLGDADPGIAPADPGQQKPRTPSGPEGLVGHYNETSMLHNGSTPGTLRVAIKTLCVRNTDQCASFKSYQSGDKTPVNSLLFVDGKWQLVQRSQVNCPDGTTAATEKHEEYSLPQPVSRPLQRVTGSERFDATDTCPAQQLDLTLERTGD